jgi:hypothetical protein
MFSDWVTVALQPGLFLETDQAKADFADSLELLSDFASNSHMSKSKKHSKPQGAHSS